MTDPAWQAWQDQYNAAIQESFYWSAKRASEKDASCAQDLIAQELLNSAMGRTLDKITSAKETEGWGCVHINNNPMPQFFASIDDEGFIVLCRECWDSGEEYVLSRMKCVMCDGSLEGQISIITRTQGITNVNFAYCGSCSRKIRSQDDMAYGGM